MPEPKAKIVARAHPVKVQPFFRAWSSALAAGSA